MTKFRTVWGLVAGIAVVALVVGGLAVASNMGFKFVPNIPSNGAFNLSLPWNNNYAKAEDLRKDIASYGPVDRVSRYNADSTLSNWNGKPPGKNFAIAKGEAYIVFGGNGGVQPVIVGSHDPNFTINIAAGDAFNAAAPYHQTLNKAEDLRKDIESQFPGSVDRVARYNSDSTLSNWNGKPPGKNFDLALGSGVIIFAKSAISGYVWPHY